jgi:hypothetical protein
MHRRLSQGCVAASATPGDAVGLRGYVGGYARAPPPAGEAASPMESLARFRYHA